MKEIKAILDGSWRDDNSACARGWATALQVIAWLDFVGWILIGIFTGLNAKESIDVFWGFLGCPVIGGVLLIFLSAAAEALLGIAQITENTSIISKLEIKKMELALSKKTEKQEPSISPSNT